MREVPSPVPDTARWLRLDLPEGSLAGSLRLEGQAEAVSRGRSSWAPHASTEARGRTEAFGHRARTSASIGQSELDGGTCLDRAARVPGGREMLPQLRQHGVRIAPELRIGTGLRVLPEALNHVLLRSEHRVEVGTVEGRP